MDEHKAIFDDWYYIEFSPNKVRLEIEWCKNSRGKISKLTQKLFNDQALLVYVLLFSESGSRTSVTTEWIRKRWINLCGEVEKKMIDDWWFHLYECPPDVKNMDKVHGAVLDSDFSIDPVLDLRSFVYSKNQQIVFNLYDDRGFDIYFRDQGVLDLIFSSLRVSFWENYVERKLTIFES